MTYFNVCTLGVPEVSQKAAQKFYILLFISSILYPAFHFVAQNGLHIIPLKSYVQHVTVRQVCIYTNRINVDKSAGFKKGKSCQFNYS